MIHLQNMVKAMAKINMTMIRINRALFDTTLSPMDVIVEPASSTSLSISMIYLFRSLRYKLTVPSAFLRTSPCLFSSPKAALPISSVSNPIL